MRKLITCLGFVATAVMAVAQTYTFETDFANWEAQNGSLSRIENQCKEGTFSLQWQTSGTSQMTVSGFSGFSTTNLALAMYIHLPKATNDTLIFEYYYNAKLRGTATMLCNYRGWLETIRPYSDYSPAVSGFNKIIITLHPASSEARTIGFDNVRLKANATDMSGVFYGPQWALDKDYLNITKSVILQLFAHPRDIALVQPTIAQETEIDTIRQRLKVALPYTEDVKQAAQAAKTWLETDKFSIIDTRGSALTMENVNTIFDRLLALGSAKLAGDEEMSILFDRYFAHVFDQGIAEGCGIAYGTSAYTAPLANLGRMVQLFSATNEEQSESLARLIAWICYYYEIYRTENEWRPAINSDIVYLYMKDMLYAAAFRQDKAVALRELKAVSRYLDRVSTYTDGTQDMLKPDGTGFHHSAHYNNYMYAYQTFAETIFPLRGTSLQINENAYERFTKAALSLDIMACPATHDEDRIGPNALCGRNPFNDGIAAYFSKDYFLHTIAAGVNYPKQQERMMAAYNYFYQTHHFDVKDTTYDGMHAFNCSPVGIYRHGTWTAVMKAPIKSKWSTEIYANQNRFGRYQGTGCLEILYQGGREATGYPDATGGGWDWNTIPGTTTVHYTDWIEMMPGRNTSQQFDQFTRSTEFSGALADGELGVWCSDFDQIDTWGGQVFTPTNLTFRKTVFVLDSILVALGTNISATGSYSNEMFTATNLFQNILPLGAPQPEVALHKENGTWLVSPCGTGYYIPQGNDELILTVGNQTTPKSNGSDAADPQTTRMAAKAWLNHGVKPTSSKYSFVVIPATTEEGMSKWVSLNQQKPVFEIVQQTDTVHEIKYGDVRMICRFGKELVIDRKKGTTHYVSTIDPRTQIEPIHTAYEESSTPLKEVSHGRQKTKKYINNQGQLVIEHNEQKYNALGIFIN